MLGMHSKLPSSSTIFLEYNTETWENRFLPTCPFQVVDIHITVGQSRYEVRVQKRGYAVDGVIF